MTLEAIRTAKLSADIQLQSSYRALCHLLHSNEPALGLLSGLASLALEKHVLDQMELEVIANGSTSTPSPEIKPLARDWPPCPCGGVIDLDGELVCATCREELGI